MEDDVEDDEEGEEEEEMGSDEDEDEDEEVISVLSIFFLSTSYFFLQLIIYNTYRRKVLRRSIPQLSALAGLAASELIIPQKKPSGRLDLTRRISTKMMMMPILRWIRSLGPPRLMSMSVSVSSLLLCRSSKSDLFTNSDHYRFNRVL